VDRINGYKGLARRFLKIKGLVIGWYIECVLADDSLKKVH
jgi:hypothetical protein